MTDKIPPSYSPREAGHPTSLKTLFFGTPRFAQIVLEKLIDSPFRPQMVITAPDKKAGRGQILESSPVKQTAIENGIKVLQPEKLSDSDIIRQLLTVNCQLSILVAYGKIIPRDILSIPRYGFINVHPSLLPKYRGPSPIQSAILAGEGKTGVTIMLLDEKVDHGPILAQKVVEIEKTDTHESLIENLGKIGADLLIEVLPYYMTGELIAKPQDHSQATFTKQIKKADGFVDLANPPDPQIVDRMIRAFYPWPGTWCQLKVDSRQFSVKFLPAINNLAMKQFSNESFLIQPEGKRPMKISDIKNGYPELYEKISQLFNNQAQS